MKPILFNTEMVRAILEDCKTATRRVVKPKPLWENPPIQQKCHPEYWANWDDERIYKAPYDHGDVLYVRETWRPFSAWIGSCIGCEIEYKAGGKQTFHDRIISVPTTEGLWHPSIHMPREAARLFLRVKDVRVEQLQDIKSDGAVDEGYVKRPNYTKRGDLVLHNRYREEFAKLWDSTLKPADRDLYGWDANPWVWVIKFERITKQEAENG